MAYVREFEKATEYIMGKIRGGSLTLGSGIPSERQISAELGISRNSVREGLRALENMGVIESRHGSGNYVSGHISDSVKRTFEVMFMLQKVTMKEIADYRRGMALAVFEMAFGNPHKNKELRRLSELLDGFLEQPLEERIRRDSEFHCTLVKMANNRILSMVMSSISEAHTQWVRQVLAAMPENGMRQLDEAHRKIFESLVHNDKSAGMAAIAEHYFIIEMMADDFQQKSAER